MPEIDDWQPLVTEEDPGDWEPAVTAPEDPGDWEAIPTGPSNRLLNYAKEKEGFARNPYDDYGQVSIGYGTRAQPGDREIDEEEAGRRLAGELQESYNDIDTSLQKNLRWSLNQQQRDALTSFHHNTGKGAELLETSIDNDDLAFRMSKYTKAGGKDLGGLVRRRREEVEMFEGPTTAEGPTKEAVKTESRYARAEDPKLRDVNPDLVDRVHALEESHGQFKINSGFRDPDKNAQVGGARGSQHIHGNAVDIDVSGMSKEERRKLISDASAAGIQGIGVYNNALHFDLGKRRSWGPSHGRESVPGWAEDLVSAHEKGPLEPTDWAPATGDETSRPPPSGGAPIGDVEESAGAPTIKVGATREEEPVSPDKPLPLVKEPEAEADYLGTISDGLTDLSSPQVDLSAIKRGLMESGIGIEETVNRYTYAPMVHKIRQAMEYVAPNSGAASFAAKLDDDFKKHLEDDRRRKQRLQEQGKESGVAGEVVQATAKMGGDLSTIMLTGGLLPSVGAASTIFQKLTHGAASMTMPALQAAADAGDRAAKEGKGEAEQFIASITALGETLVTGALPMAVTSKAATLPGRIAGRTAKAVPVAGATVEAQRGLHNLLSPLTGEERRPFSGKEFAVGTVPLALLGTTLGGREAPVRGPTRAKAAEQIAEKATGAPVGATATTPTQAKGFEMLAGGRKIPGKPDIGRGWNLLFRGYEGTADMLEKAGQPILAGRLREYTDIQRKYSAFASRFRPWQKGMSSSDVSAAEAGFKKYWESVDNNGLAASHAVYDASSPKVKEAIDIWKSIAVESGAILRDKGFQVEDPVQGWRPMGNLGEGFFPRRVSPKWLKIMRNKDRHPAEYAKIQQALIAKGMDPAAVDKYVAQNVGLTKDPDSITSLEHARTSKLPTFVYDYGFDTVKRYIANFADEAAKFEAFGQSRGGQDPTAFDAARERAEGNEANKSYVNQLEATLYGKETGLMARIAQTARMGSTVSFLANFRSTLRNLISGTQMNVQQAGVREGTKNLLQAGRASKEIESAYEKGILHEDLSNLMTDDGSLSDFGNSMRKTVNKTLKWAGYRGVEEYARSVSFMGAKSKLHTMLEDSRNDPLSRRALNNAAYVKRLGIDPQTLLDEKGQGPLTDRYFRSAVADTQGGYGIDQTPLFLNSEAGKTLFHLQKWGTQNIRYWDHNIINPALQAIKTGRQENVTLRDKQGNLVESRVPGEIKPLVRSLFLLTVAGLTQKEAEEFLFGIKDKEASFAEILMKMDDDTVDAFGLMAHKLFSAWTSIGMMGTVGNLAKTMEVMGFEGLTPPPFQILKTAGKFVYKAFEEGRVTLANVQNSLAEQFTTLRNAGQIASRVAVAREQAQYLGMVEKKQELGWLRSLEKRFASDEGLAEQPKFRGTFASGPRRPFYDDFEQKLLLGDRKGAREAWKQETKGMTIEEKESFDESLKKSVMANRPISVAGSKGEATRAKFLQWVKKAQPKGTMEKVRKIDDTYRNTASALGLFAPKELTPEDIEEKYSKTKLKNILRQGKRLEDFENIE